MSRLGIGVIGLGPAAEPHAKCLQELAGRVEVRMAVSRTEARTRAFADRFGFPVTTDVNAVLADATIQAVLVLTPPASHLEVGAKCLAAGKHVLVEKPIDTDLWRGEQLVAKARDAGLRLGVVLQHRFRPGSVRLRKRLEANELGEVEAASMAVPWWRPQAYYDEPGRGTLARDGGGVLLTQAIHTLDLFRSLVGVSRVDAARAVTTGLHRMETEDWVSALVRLGNGAPGAISATTAAYPGGPERIEIIGTKGTAYLVGGGLRIACIDGREEVLESEGGTGGGANIMDFPIDAHLALLTNFVDAIETGRDPIVTGEEAVTSQRLVTEILAAADGSRPIG